MKSGQKVENVRDWEGLEKHIPALAKKLEIHYNKKFKKEGDFRSTSIHGRKMQSMHKKRDRTLVANKIKRDSFGHEKYYEFLDKETGKVLYRKALTLSKAYEMARRLVSIGIIIRQQNY